MPRAETIVRLAKRHLRSEFDLFRQGHRVIELDPEIANRILQLAVAKQELNRAKIPSLLGKVLEQKS
jgi:hypothetical protein